MRRRVAMNRMVSAIIGAMVLAPAVCGCQMLPRTVQPGHRLSLAARRPAMLAVILGSSSAHARAEFLALVAETARTGEQLVVLSNAGSTLLPTTRAPAPPTMPGPAFPKPPPRNATSFQKATYAGALRRARAVLRRDLAMLRAQDRQRLRSWATSAVAKALSAAGRAGNQHGDVATAITEAAADVASMQQARVPFGTRVVIAIIGSEAAIPPQSQASLSGATVVVADVPAARDEAAWQVALLEAGAANVFPLTSATESRLAGIADLGLARRPGIAVMLAHLRYGPAQYTLPQAADPVLRHVLHLLEVVYPEASASINGYTDDIAVPGGNLRLSWRRADAVLTWLARHGIAADRLHAVGHGVADPVAPNGPHGQPLNRRVILIISPGT